MREMLDRGPDHLGTPERAVPVGPDPQAAAIRTVDPGAALVGKIDGAGHAAPFDAPANFVQLIADTITSEQLRALG